jgi:hypothetical protein
VSSGFLVPNCGVASVNLQVPDNQRFLQVATQLGLAAVTFEIAGTAVAKNPKSLPQWMRHADQNFIRICKVPSSKTSPSGSQITCNQFWVQIAQKPGEEGLQATQDCLNKFVAQMQRSQNQELAPLGLSPLKVMLPQVPSLQTPPAQKCCTIL